ncbi:Non-specific serine/threonine protein kinase [Saliniradius amylolyticus]|uniref:Non-specific serine/threonine protein kinase n=1 Tax=Saliniradius amylolyticus TaxID=2183582 RepID=A0A2S2E6Y3_9ALTE|nr:formylglycine-generating enzyme family protein [Saliniradius amylolyticus]AWL13408.1 Non-specific serine/threonine protein kinase [Saliniradius amylolyticus]
MNRIAHLALAIALTYSTGLIAQQSDSVEDIRQQIQTNQSEYDSYHQTLQKEQAQANQLESELADLRQKNKELEEQRQQRLNQMNQQYEKIIEDPSVDIEQYRQSYLEAVRAHKQNKDAITDKYNAWQAKLADVEQLRISKHGLLNKIENLKEELNNARVDRLYNEFNRTDTISVQHSIQCDREETIAKCSNRGKFLAKQKASKRFLDELYNGLTESELASKQRPYSDAYVQVMHSDIVDDGFSGNANYQVSINAKLKGSMNRAEACDLLALDRRYCLNRPEQAEVVTETPQEMMAAQGSDESKMYELTLRSNVYDDEVFIDGESYGSTKLQVMLPAGPHTIEVVKRGYQPITRKIDLRESTTMRVELDKAQFAFNKGEKIQDILVDDIQGPTLVVIPAGSFKMGDINGNGLSNERPVETRQIDESFGLTETEITVADFRHFAKATSYVTDAEKGKGCAYYEGGKPVWNDKLNWRQPGYNNTDKHPVVCISQRDAKAYVDWLSKTSGTTYRLPSEVEWEYAARAGTESDFWWGDSIGTNNANCGWCGSEWSNQSAAPVATFDENGYGLFDTVGNVWEWTTSEEAKSGAIVRGGAWSFAPRLARVSTRMELEPSFRANYIGLRVVREQ